MKPAARLRFRDGGRFDLIGASRGIMRAGVLDGTDRHGYELCALPTDLEGLDEDARAFLAAAVVAYQASFVDVVCP